MTLERFMRDAILWLSAFSVGTALFTAALCLRMVKSNPRRYLAFAAAKFGYAVVVGVILIRILLPITEVGADVWAWVYLVGVAVAGVGFIGVGRAVRLEFIEWENKKRED